MGNIYIGEQEVKVIPSVLFSEKANTSLMTKMPVTEVYVGSTLIKSFGNYMCIKYTLDGRNNGYNTGNTLVVKIPRQYFQNLAVFNTEEYHYNFDEMYAYLYFSHTLPNNDKAYFYDTIGNLPTNVQIDIYTATYYSGYWYSISGDACSGATMDSDLYNVVKNDNGIFNVTFVYNHPTYLGLTLMR